MAWGPQGRFGPNFGNPHFMIRRPDTLDDRLVVVVIVVVVVVIVVVVVDR